VNKWYFGVSDDTVAARMEQGVKQDQFPDFAALHPGYGL
jgi:hypothetical protein